MARQFVKMLKDGEAVDEIYLLADKQLRANRNAALYLNADLRDKTGAINARMWNVNEAHVSHLQVGQFVRVRGKVQLFQGTLQLILSTVDPIAAEHCHLPDFQQEPNQQIDAMREELTNVLGTIIDPAIKGLADQFLNDTSLMAAFSQSPAGVKAHHAYPGGLLEHVLTLMKLADFVSGIYPDVSRDLMIMGVFLHDLGKTRELHVGTTLTYTDEGQLLGHLIIGIEQLTAKIRQWETAQNQTFPAETSLRLKHMILSHHGSYEFGSPKLPMTPEAVALHQIDILDAKVNEVSNAIADDPQGESSWTLFHPRLERKLFKGKASSRSAEKPTASTAANGTVTSNPTANNPT